ncbi:hypothetical protein [Methylobacterium platani]|uniref:Uncharacterized protein n=2 Tax=Methylobacterium platani TaxID=427683 RepID=A0A179SDQ6_9HYPH|nr:hypothetical protein [Methylobacterium platani]KMO09897.1 hypothetical protein SQ03_31380 [Methylobacterium platani JCM 14648]OAS24619.1 hypothetical protein A5481_12810 [Methylobacterium platani]
MMMSRTVKKPTDKPRNLPPIRVRKEPPTVSEAVAAAQDLADDVEQQVEIAAGLIGLPPEEVRPHVLQAAQVLAAKPRERAPERIISAGSGLRAPRTVIVERRAGRPLVERRIRPPLDGRR